KIFGEIADARSRYTSASGANQKAEAATQVESTLTRLIAIMENYPQLKSSENVQTLMAQLEGTENRISVERKRYNDVVQAFNVTIKRFPTNLIANMLGYSAKNYFESEAGTGTAPKVNL
ncbi:MAG: LemA family protein, partial [Candidatus Falkowbacteria bacterium]|nr:LemA family protein [Candidatus Falkowbacteria bacterium]